MNTYPGLIVVRVSPIAVKFDYVGVFQLGQVLEDLLNLLFLGLEIFSL